MIDSPEIATLSLDIQAAMQRAKAAGVTREQMIDLLAGILGFCVAAGEPHARSADLAGKAAIKVIEYASLAWADLGADGPVSGHA